MSDAQLPNLPPEIAELLAIESARPGLSAAATGRILDRLDATLSVPPPPPRRRWPAALGSFVLGLLVGGALVGALLYPRLAPVQPKLLMLDAPPPASPVVVVVPAPSIPPVAAPDVPSSPALRHGGARSERRGLDPQSTSAAEPERDTELARERALIETARTAVARKQRDAIDVLLRHEQQFPRGRLAEERESLLVQALLQSGRLEEARSRGARFRSRWPHSFLLPVIDAALRSIP